MLEKYMCPLFISGSNNHHFNNEIEEIMTKKYLESNEINRLEIRHERRIAEKLQMENLSLQKQIVRHKQTIAELQRLLFEKDVKILEFQHSQMKEIHDAEMAQHLNFIDNLKEKYQLTDGFGFDPDTGEIKERD